MHRFAKLPLAAFLALATFSSAALAHPGHIHWVEDGLALVYGAAVVGAMITLHAIASARWRTARLDDAGRA